MFLKLKSEINALGNPALRGLAIKALAWRLLYVPALLWSLPFAIVFYLLKLLEAIQPGVALLFGTPTYWISEKRSALYARAADIIARDETRADSIVFHGAFPDDFE